MVYPYYKICSCFFLNEVDPYTGMRCPKYTVKSKMQITDSAIKCDPFKFKSKTINMDVFSFGHIQKKGLEEYTEN